MRVTAKVDYAVRAMVELAAASPGAVVKADAIVTRDLAHPDALYRR